MDRKAEAQYLAAAVEAADIKDGGERRAFVLGTLKAIINADDLTPKEIVGRCRYFLAEVGIRERDIQAGDQGVQCVGRPERAGRASEGVRKGGGRERRGGACAAGHGAHCAGHSGRRSRRETLRRCDDGAAVSDD